MALSFAPMKIKVCLKLTSNKKVGSYSAKVPVSPVLCSPMKIQTRVFLSDPHPQHVCGGCGRSHQSSAPQHNPELPPAETIPDQLPELPALTRMGTAS